jgi:hypothetical protein
MFSVRYELQPKMPLRFTAGIRRLLTAKAPVRSQDSPREICGRENGIGDSFFPRYFGFPLSGSFHQYSALIVIYTLLLPSGKTDEAWEPVKKATLFRISGRIT